MDAISGNIGATAFSPVHNRTPSPADVVPEAEPEAAKHETERHRQTFAALQPEDRRPPAKFEQRPEPQPRVETAETARIRAEMVARTAYHVVAQIPARDNDVAEDRERSRPVRAVSRAA